MYGWTTCENLSVVSVGRPSGLIDRPGPDRIGGYYFHTRDGGLVDHVTVMCRIYLNCRSI